jgi:hypothetical protein
MAQSTTANPKHPYSMTGHGKKQRWSGRNTGRIPFWFAWTHSVHKKIESRQNCDEKWIWNGYDRVLARNKSNRRISQKHHHIIWQLACWYGNVQLSLTWAEAQA